jgi:polyisoprenoid-binding protein YceI
MALDRRTLSRRSPLAVARTFPAAGGSVIAVTAVLQTAILAVATIGTAAAGEWEVDPPHTTAQFAVRHMMVTTVRGQFDKVSGTVTLDEQDLTRSTIDIRIDAATINTREPKRDEHLRSPDFFDVAKHPQITFRSTKIEKAGQDRFRVTGDLAMHGVTRPVTLTVEGPTPPIKNPWGRLVRGVSATGTINRKDWGLTWNKALETGGVLVGEEVALQIDAELVQKEAAPPAAGAR